MSLSLKQLTDVCLANSGTADVCRYLKQDDTDYDKWYCLKHKVADKTRIDDKVSEHIRDCRKQGVDPADAGHPLGDNCDGYPLLKYKSQGYDVKSN